MICFQDRLRLLRHLREQQKTCLVQAMRFLEPLEDQEVEELDALDLEAISTARKQGVQRPPVQFVAVRAAGPLRRPA